MNTVELRIESRPRPDQPRFRGGSSQPRLEWEVKQPEIQMVCGRRFDGKDYPVSIGGGAVKQTLAFERKSPTTIKTTTKLDGKLLFTDVLTLSADGKTLVDDAMPASVNEPSKAVYERQ